MFKLVYFFNSYLANKGAALIQSYQEDCREHRVLYRPIRRTLMLHNTQLLHNTVHT